MNPVRCIAVLALNCACAVARGADLSPASWPVEERERVEALQLLTAPRESRVVEAKSGLIAATIAPVAIRAGLEALRQGGTAADAAATVALTQVTMAMGSYVSFAGTLQLVYFEAKTGKVHALNALWGTYANETDPNSIPKMDQLEGEQGRKTLVPGFMAGIGAMHQRFGVLPFAELFAPAIWYAENGRTLSPQIANYFASREKFLSRTPEGKAFARRMDGRLPVVRDRVYQRELAQTLRSVAEHGAQEMYTGEWGRAFVAAVQREGGKVTLDDLKRYAPVWEQPLQTEFAGHTIYAPGAGTQGGFDLLQALNLIEALQVGQMPPYWKDPASFVRLSRALEFAQMNGFGGPFLTNWARTKGVALDPAQRATKEYTRATLPLLDAFLAPPPRPPSSDHSDGIIVIDAAGNVAALVHTINTVLWGTTGIVVGGIPLSDAACFQQRRLAQLAPGAMVPSEMTPVIACRDGKPTLAIATIGAALHPETARIILGLLDQRLDPQEVMMAPSFLLSANYGQRGTVQLPQDRYDQAFITALRTAGLTPHLKTPQEVGSIKGTAVIATLDPVTGMRRTLEVPRHFGFAGGY